VKKIIIVIVSLMVVLGTKAYAQCASPVYVPSAPRAQALQGMLVQQPNRCYQQPPVRYVAVRQCQPVYQVRPQHCQRPVVYRQQQVVYQSYNRSSYSESRVIVVVRL
jgi:hypothetical protein